MRTYAGIAWAGVTGFASNQVANAYAAYGPWNPIGQMAPYGSSLSTPFAAAVNGFLSAGDFRGGSVVGGHDSATDPPGFCIDTRSGRGTGSGVPTSPMTCCSLNASICGGVAPDDANGNGCACPQLHCDCTLSLTDFHDFGSGVSTAVVA